MRVVYIFGAGASAAEGVPVMRSLLRAAYRYFKEEKYESEMDIVWEFLECFYGGREVIRVQEDLDRYPGIDEIFNIVDWYLLHNQSFSAIFSGARLEQLKTALVKLISMTLDRTRPSGHGIYYSFVNEALKEENGCPTFISLNYDIVLDRAIRAAGYTPGYGFTMKNSAGTAGPPQHAKEIPLYKLHGSLNWSYCPLCGEISEHEEKVAHLLFKERNAVACPGCGGESSRAVIIAPTLYKSNKISRLNWIWDSAGRAISLSEKVVFIGYSLAFADTSLIATVKRALNAPDKSREIVVINPSRRACRRYMQFFGNGCRILCTSFSSEVLPDIFQAG